MFRERAPLEVSIANALVTGCCTRGLWEHARLRRAGFDRHCIARTGNGLSVPEDELLLPSLPNQAVEGLQGNCRILLFCGRGPWVSVAPQVICRQT